MCVFSKKKKKKKKKQKKTKEMDVDMLNVTSKPNYSDLITSYKYITHYPILLLRMAIMMKFVFK